MLNSTEIEEPSASTTPPNVSIITESKEATTISTLSAVASAPSRTNESSNLSPATQSFEHFADGTDNVSDAKVTKQAKPPNIMSKYLVQYVPKTPRRRKPHKPELLVTRTH